MLHGRKLFVAFAACAVAMALVHAALADDSKDSAHGTMTAGNGIYDVAVEDSDSGMGQYTARTADSHPVTIDTGQNQNILFGGAIESPGTSWSTIRSYTSQTDYVNDDSSSKTSGFNVISLDPYATVEAIGATGVRTIYEVTVPGQAADDLTIVEDVDVNGSTAANSSIEITTTVTNNGATAVDIGIRYLWDWQISSDDGPSFTPIDPDGAVVVTEQTYVSPGFTAYAIKDNHDAGSPLFVVYGTVNGPSAIDPVPVPPDVLMFTYWPGGNSVAFDYTTNPSSDVATGYGDSAVLYYWGPDSQDAISLDPDESVTVSASLFAAPPDEPPPFVEPTPTPRKRATRTLTPTPTATEVPPTETPVPVATSTPLPPPATATPMGGTIPEIQAPPTGEGVGHSGFSMLWLGLAAGGTGAVVLGASLRRARSRR
jgi:hypothetical protein